MVLRPTTLPDLAALGFFLCLLLSGFLMHCVLKVFRLKQVSPISSVAASAQNALDILAP
jgi:hypothetical protein